MVLKKSKSVNKTLFIDASKECVKVTNSNKLTTENIQTIIAFYEDRQSVEYLARLVDNNEIATKDYTLSISTYVEQEDTREVVDIHLLNEEIKELVSRVNVLRNEIDKIIAEIEGSKYE